MSLADKFDGLLPGSHGTQPAGPAHVETISTHAPADAIVIPDANLLFTGDFKRSGVDLVLSKDDRELVLHDYFKGEKRAALASPDGAHLTPELVNALSGHVQLAQADGSASTAKVIGHVTKLTGTATAIRNGVSIILNQGDNVHKGDVVQSGSDSTLGITFIDGSVFGLGQNARMVLNEMIYDPNGSNNSSLLSLVQGTISFVAGAAAKHGDMKVDTPVATMGIRGTAVLVEIDFEVPGQGSAPPAKFQVLVEPDGTTGSYILFDKTTLTPLATVNQAGTQTIINAQGNVSFLSGAQLSAEAQKIITDVFSLKFTNNTNPNTKLTTNFTDSIVPISFGLKLANGDFIYPTLFFGQAAEKLASAPANGPGDRLDHIPGPPTVATFGAAFTERAGITHSSATDAASNQIRWVDINAGDTPSATAKFDSFAYKDAHNNDVTASLTAEQLAAILAAEIPLQVVQGAGNKNTGFATWTYTLGEDALDFLAAGETLTLTYLARVDNNFAANNEFTLVPITITITGTNDAPTVTTAGRTIVERIGTGNTALGVASGTVTFTDVDLTDRPMVSAALSSSQPFVYLDAQGHDVTAGLTAEQKAVIASVEIPLSVVQSAGNGHNGSATWTYSIADHAFDFLAKGETLVLNYVVTVDDGHGGVISTPITVSINGADVSVIGTNDIPTIATTSNAFTELANPVQPNPTGSTTPDIVTGTISFTDVDLTDRPVASASFISSTYTDAAHHALTLSSVQQTAVSNVAVPLVVTQAAGNTHDGSASWSYSVPDGAFDFLGTGEILTLTYTATVDDGHGGVVTKPLTVTVTGTNDTPKITSGTQAGDITEIADTTNASTPDQATGTITFIDPDLTDAHAVTITDVGVTGKSTGLANHATVLGWLSLGTLTDSGNGVTGSRAWAFSAADNGFDYLADGETLTLTYTVKIDDHHGGVVTQPVTIAITGSNDAPVALADSDQGTIVEAGNDVNDNVLPGVATTSGDVLANDTDVDLTDTHDVVGVVAGTATGVLSGGVGAGVTGIYGTLVLNADGSWTYTLNNNDPDTDALAQGAHADDIFTYTESDHHGGTSTTTLTIGITGTNDAPVANAAPAAATDLNAGVPVVEQGVDPSNTPMAGLDTASGNVLANDFDVDSGDSKTVQGVASGTAAGPLTGAVATEVTGHHGKVTIAANGSWSYTLDNADPDTQALTQGQHVSDVFTYTMRDAEGATASATLIIDITGSNDAPTLADVNAGALTDTSINDGFADLTGTLAGNDRDSGETTSLTYAALDSTRQLVTTAVAGHYGSLTVDTNGSYDYVPDPVAIDALPVGNFTDTFTVQTTDVHGATGTATLTVHVTGANDAPVVAAALTDNVDEGDAAFTRDLLSGASDVDHGATLHIANVSYAVDGGAGSTTAPAGVSLDADGHTLAVDPADPSFDLMAGEYTTIVVSYDVTDAQGATVAQTETITVAGTDDTPTSTINALTLDMNDPGKAPAQTIVASVSDETLTGHVGRDTFVFNFTGVGHDTVTDFRPGTDTLQFGSAIFATAQAALNATLDDGAGNTVISLDSHDTITLTGVLKAQLHAADFHVT